MTQARLSRSATEMHEGAALACEPVHARLPCQIKLATHLKVCDEPMLEVLPVSGFGIVLLHIDDHTQEILMLKISEVSPRTAILKYSLG